MSGLPSSVRANPHAAPFVFPGRRLLSRRAVLPGLPFVSQLLGCWSWPGSARASGLQSLAGQSPGPASARARNCIVIWLDGGPSHLETWDLKPEAPREVRGPLQGISTSVPGIQVSECFAQIAARMQQVAIIRSMTSPLGEHNLGAQYLLTGYQPTRVLDYPTIPALGTYVRQQQVLQSPPPVTANTLPTNVAIPNFSVGGATLSPQGYLPARTSPFAVGGDPASSSFEVNHLSVTERVTLSRLERRRQYFQQMQSFDDASDGQQSGESSGAFDQAFQMLLSPAARQAFDLSSEPAAVRRRYGPKTIGQSCLLARRLVERGVPFVTVNMRGWDTHASLYTQLKEGFTGAVHPVGLIPSLDLAFSALLDDLTDRGLLQETLIVVMGEFGRTPKLNAAGGRDHWPRVFSVALAGGGVTGGQVVGASDRTGESPAERSVTPSDLACSIYTLLGIDPAREFLTADGRPVRVSPHDATPVSELWS